MSRQEKSWRRTTTLVVAGRRGRLARCGGSGSLAACWCEEESHTAANAILTTSETKAITRQRIQYLSVNQRHCKLKNAAGEKLRGRVKLRRLTSPPGANTALR